MTSLQNVHALRIQILTAVFAISLASLGAVLSYAQSMTAQTVRQPSGISGRSVTRPAVTTTRPPLRNAASLSSQRMIPMMRLQKMRESAAAAQSRSFQAPRAIQRPAVRTFTR